jgi:RNA polymerase sigma-70 factor, ECF subfamily
VSAVPSDLALLVALGQGDVTALAALYDRYAAAVYGLALALTATPAEAEAVTLTVFLTLWHTARAGRFGEQALGSWLRAAVRAAARAPRELGPSPPGGPARGLGFGCRE